jgi:epoxyqueuosine reductase QueG
MEIETRLAGLLREGRIDFLGVSDLSPAADFILEQGGDYIAALPVGISIGIGLPNAIVDLLPRRAERAVALSYRHGAYDVVNQRLDLAASEIASGLQREGFRAFPIPASSTVDETRHRGIFSHKLAANLAGLGWIGKNCLLITPERGPRVRWATVLTDAPLKAGGARMAERCGECRLCVDACPVKAFTGRGFSPDEPREARFRAESCDRHFKAMKARGESEVCGMCLHACPYGRA